MADNETSYLKEMLFSPGNIYAVLGMLAASVAVSVPYGLEAGLVPLIALVAGEAVAALFVPFSPGFREKVDKRNRKRVREAEREHLLAEIERRKDMMKGAYGSFSGYQRMVGRVNSIYRIAEDSRTSITLQDAERLDDSSIDYLRMWLAVMVTEERSRAVSVRDIEARLAAIEQDLEKARPGTDQTQLNKARNEYLSMLTRHRRMASRKTAIEAVMLSMPDQMDELYQAIVTAPTASETGTKLADAIARFGLEEALENELEGAMREALPDFPVVGAEVDNLTSAAVQSVQKKKTGQKAQAIQ